MTGDLSLARPEHLPEFARPWRVRYARWDGGPIHVAKGILSGWIYLPEPYCVYAMTNWYSPQTIALLRAAGINWIWVTWSVGFPPEDESLQWDILRPYIALCHHEGTHVTAYLSMTNMCRALWVRQHPESEGWIQRDRQGNLIPYGAAHYPEAPTRYLACLSHPDWQTHLLRVAGEAIAAGVDAIEYDNAGSGCQCERCQAAYRAFAREHFGREYDELPDFASITSGVVGQVQRVVGSESKAPLPDEQSILIWHRFVNHLIGQTYARVAAYARARKSDILVYGNNNTEMQTFTYPATNAISTEDAAEPGWVEGRLVQNGGLLRLLQAASDGWKPVRLEYGIGHGAGEIDKRVPARGVGSSRFWPMSPRKQQLAIAEAAAHGASMEVTPEGYLSVDLFYRRPEAMSIWEAVGKYHTFMASHEDLYEHPQSVATTAFLLNDDVDYPADPQRKHLLNALAGTGLDYDVLFDRQLPEADLSRYHLLVLPDTHYLSDESIARLRAFGEKGGQLLVTGKSGHYDDRFLLRATWPLADLPGLHHRPDLDDVRAAVDTTCCAAFVAAIRELSAPPPVTVEASEGVLARTLSQPEQKRYLLHLLNYNDAPAGPVVVRGRFTSEKAILYSPDAPAPALAKATDGLRIEGLDIYAVVVLPWATS